VVNRNHRKRRDVVESCRHEFTVLLNEESKDFDEVFRSRLPGPFVVPVFVIHGRELSRVRDVDFVKLTHPLSGELVFCPSLHVSLFSKSSEAHFDFIE
jgi:hypothetical protein